MPFRLTPHVHVERATNGTPRQLRHLQQPYLAPGKSGRSLAAQYVQDVAQLYGLPDDALKALDSPFRAANRMTSEPTSLRLSAENAVRGGSTVTFVQTLGDLPIWEAGLTVMVQTEPDCVTSSFSTFHHDAKVEPAERDFRPYSAAELEQLLPLGKWKVEITSQRRLIYRYEAAQRIDPEAVATPTPLLPIPDTITEGSHHVVVEVLFTTDPGPASLNWRAFIQERTGSVLYLHALVASVVGGNVFNIDPVSDTGNGALTSCSGNATLDPIQTTVTLPVIPASPQSLTTEFVTVNNARAPNNPPPTSPPTNFTALQSDSADFGAVNTLYHVDRFFRLMSSVGIDPTVFFTDTTLPLPVDHFDSLTVLGTGQIGGYVYGNPGGIGCASIGLAYASVPAQTCANPVLAGCDQRVAFHECSHVLQWEKTHQSRFAFCHSTGDSLAVIFADPQSIAPDRYATLPFITSPVGLPPRRHDRNWAWGGANDDGNYGSEQILATTQFRLYLSTGGGDTRKPVQTYASNCILHLIISAVGRLPIASSTPITSAGVWVTFLLEADKLDPFAGVPGGTLHKVIPWAFEKQGLTPPPVDVYIDDGRGGEYPYVDVFWNNTDIWNRLAPDGGTTHETPIVGVANHAYVRVKNRGTQNANNVTVSGYQSKPASGLSWPHDWTAMTTASLPAGSIAPGGSTVVGPFVWTPQVVGHECMLMIASADGDLPNTDPATLLPCASGPTPHWRLVPFDNNIGQRNVAPVAGGGGSAGLAASFRNRSFAARNPFDRRVEITLEAVLPEFLTKRGWSVRFFNVDRESFTLPPRGEKTVVFTLAPGKDFSAADVPGGKAGRIEIHTRVDDLLIGGMSYQVDAKLAAPPPEERSTKKMTS
jgi:hypothetical protein